MFDAVSIYDRLKNSFPEIEAFRIPLEEAYDNNASEGKQIDLANTIFECIGKNAWSKIPNAPRESKIEKASITEILAGAKPFFEENDNDFYDEIYDALISPAGRILGNRSTSGDISHGHLYTKPNLSLAHASMSLNLALTFASYYFLILDESFYKIRYDEHNEEGQFNEWLNAKGAKIGGASYSWLVYQHDYAAYEEYYDEFQYEIEQAQ